MAEQLYAGIVGFLELHPFLADSPIYIAGESYAGKYIPAIAHYIFKQHQAGDTSVNMAGIAIGNGETKPYTAYASTPDYLFNMGYIDEKQQDLAHEQLKVRRGSHRRYPVNTLPPFLTTKSRTLPCDSLRSSQVCKDQVDRGEYILAFETCQKMEDDLFANYVKLPFIYDLRAKSDIFTSLTSVATKWLNKPAVKRALNVGSRPWRQSDGQGPSSVGKVSEHHCYQLHRCF